MRTQITNTERLVLQGILALSQMYAKKTRDLEKAAEELLECDLFDLGHFGDAMWSDDTIDDILKRMEIEVES